MKTRRSAVWQGGIKEGKGAISTKSGALKEYPYGFSKGDYHVDQDHNRSRPYPRVRFGLTGGSEEAQHQPRL